MIKKCLFLLCALFVAQTKCDCSEDFIKCFSDFAESFFRNITAIEHVNASVDNLPKDYEQVKDVEIKTIQEIADAIQNDFFKQFNSHTDVVVTDNPKTNIYVKAFNYDFGDSLILGLENINSNSDEDHSEDVEELFGLERVKDKTFSSNDHSTIPSDVSLSVSDYNSEALITENKKEPNKNNERELKIKIENIESIKAENPTTTRPNDKQKQNEKETNTHITKPPNEIDEILTTNKNLEPKDSSIILNLNHDTKIQKKNKPTNGTTAKITDNNKISIANNEKLSEDRPTQTARPNNGQAYFAGKQFEKDIRENLIRDDENDYDTDDTTDYPQIDYIDLYKDTTNEENLYVPTDKPNVNIKDEIIENIEEYSLEIETDLDNDNNFTNICHGNTSDVSNIYPWIASIFIKNDTANNQFQYTCDGALLSDKLLITAARCVTFLNSTVELDDVLVFLGKRSLQVMGEGEKNVRISQVIIHANFSTGDGKVMNDLALLVLEEPVAFSGGIRPACLGSGDDFGKSASTAWDLSGALTPVFFENNKDCREMETDGTLCATYGNEVALCPSYGGIFASKHADRWYLHGIRSGDVADRGVCYSKNVAYTPLSDHHNWIMKYIE